MTEKKILKYQNAIEISRILKKEEKIIGLCHGCFDLLHIGHLRHFESASKKCDFLFISVTPDQFVNKGPNRPVITENDRLLMISKLNFIDFVFLNNSISAQVLLNDFLPNIFFKGIEYKNNPELINPNFLLEKEVLLKNGGEMVFTDDEIRSTTQIIKRINSK